MKTIIKAPHKTPVMHRFVYSVVFLSVLYRCFILHFPFLSNYPSFIYSISVLCIQEYPHARARERYVNS
jgi:hypothetical protein